MTNEGRPSAILIVDEYDNVEIALNDGESDYDHSKLQ